MPRQSTRAFGAIPAHYPLVLPRPWQPRSAVLVMSRFGFPDVGFCAAVGRIADERGFYASLKIGGKLADVLEVEPAELLRLPRTRSDRAKRK
jgi:hypothetical protein